MVLNLLRRGARVAALDLKADALAETVPLAGAGKRLTVHEVNVADAERVAALPEEVIAAHGTVDGLLNVAGIIQPFVKFAELDRAVMERVMDVNFWGVVNTTQAFLPHLLKRPAASVVNVSSMGGFLPVPGHTVYGASKAAVKLLTERGAAPLLADWGPRNAFTCTQLGGPNTQVGSRIVALFAGVGLARSAASRRCRWACWGLGRASALANRSAGPESRRH